MGHDSLALRCVAEEVAACALSCQSERTGGIKCSPRNDAQSVVATDALMEYLYERMLSYPLENEVDRLKAAVEVFAPHLTADTPDPRGTTPCGARVCSGCGVCGCPSLGIPPAAAAPCGYGCNPGLGLACSPECETRHQAASLVHALKALAQGWASGDGPTVHGDWYATELLDVIATHGEASA